MLPKLYDEFTSQGQEYSKTFIGTLTHCKKCEVREVRNGAYTLSLETTVNDACADMIMSQRMLGVKANPHDGIQYFEIQKTTRTNDGIIKVEAKHIKNLCFQICSEGDISREGDPYYVAGNPSQIWNLLITQYIGTQVPFIFSSDITTSANFYLGLTEAETLGNILGGKEGSFTDMWVGGEYHWDNYNISFLRNRGQDRGFQIRYGRNVSDASQSESCEGMYSHVLPYGKVARGNTKINFFAPLIEIEDSCCQYTKVYMCDCTNFLEGYEVGPAGQHYDEVQAAMTEYARKYARVNGLGYPTVSISVTLRAVLDEMAHLSLCDTVSVILDPFGTRAKAKITDVTYDSLAERWEKIVIGSPQITVADFILNKRRYFNDYR